MELRNLRILRQNKKLTQTQAAVIFGVSLKSYNAWEVGDFQPKIETLIQMADYFQTTVDFIIGRDQKDFSPNEKEILLLAAKIIQEKIK
jgi:DNA-binding XRE family transcriptional regulator